MSASGKITLMQLNDSHAYLEAHQETFWSSGGAVYRKVGGLARVAAVLKQARSERPGGVLAFDGGDTIHGTYAATKTRGEALVPVLRAMGLDAMTAHWDFGYGPEQLGRIVESLGYPMLAANAYREGSGEPPFPACKVFEAGGLRVGVVGIAATIVDKTMPAAFSKGLRFTLGDTELPGLIDRLRGEERADLVVVLSHLGFPQDVKLASQVPGIDVLLSAHTHNRLRRPVRVGSTIIIQSGSHGSFVGWLDLEVEGGKITDYRHELVVMEQSLQPDPEVEALVEAAMQPFRDELGEVAGETRTGLNRATMLEATMDNLLLQSLLELTGTEAAFSNGWRFGAPVPPGQVLVNDLWNMVPVDPPVSTVMMTGEELRSMLEENLEHTFAADPFQQMGGYVKRMMGVKLHFKAENPRGERIQGLFLGGEEVRPGGAYRVAFVTEQGVPQRYGSKREALEVGAIDALRRYLKKHSPVEAELKGSVMMV